MDEEQRKLFESQTKEQFEELGRFVQQFEQMVNAVRFACLQLTTRGVEHQRLMNIIFHHRSLTAGPLFEIMRSLFGEIVNDEKNSIEKNEVTAINGVLQQIHTEYQSLLERRNTLLHGTWYIGWVSENQKDFSEFLVSKFKATSKGVESAETPKNVAELRSLTTRCATCQHLIYAFIGSFFTEGGPKITANFKKVSSVWETSVQMG